MSEAVTTTNFLDKLYEISMDKPEVWNVMKSQEYQNAKSELNKNSHR